VQRLKNRTDIEKRGGEQMQKSGAILRAVASVFALALVAVSWCFAADTVSVQGMLRSSEGVPLASASYNMQFSLFDVASGGSALWTETHNGANVVPVTQGLYSAQLGSITPFPGTLFRANPNLWLEVAVDTNGNGNFESEEIFAPRQNLTSAPFAHQASNADNLDGKDSAEFIDTSANSQTKSGALALQSDLIVNGNVGIGTTLPSQRLEVKEDSAASGATAVYGYATGTGFVVINYGGKFSAAGDSGRGVYGEATATGNVTNYGGQFSAAGTYGRGVYGAATATSAINYGGYFSASGTNGRGVYGEATATGNVTNYGGQFSAAGNAAFGVQGSATATGSATNYGGVFSAAGNGGCGIWADATATGAVQNWGGLLRARGNYGRGAVGEGGSQGYDFYANGPGTNYGPFTGAHEVKLSADFPAEPKPGMIVSATGETQVRKDDTGKVTLSSTLPTVQLSNLANDSKVLGAIVAESPLPEDHWYPAKPGERFGIVNALGEGRVWVSNINGEIEAGDYVTTANIPGYGQRQDDDLVHNYTLGKAIETVDWDKVTQTIEYDGKQYKVYLLAVIYVSG
jgi:hypothetical protein